MILSVSQRYSESYTGCQSNDRLTSRWQRLHTRYATPVNRHILDRKSPSPSMSLTAIIGRQHSTDRGSSTQIEHRFPSFRNSAPTTFFHSTYERLLQHRNLNLDWKCISSRLSFSGVDHDYNSPQNSADGLFVLLHYINFSNNIIFFFAP